ncbi:MAG: phosphoribosylamine--glycine ligase [Planctomycetota bacterium]
MADSPSTNDAPRNVLLIGSGGREHALALALARSPSMGTLFVTDAQHPGLAALGTPVDVPVSTQEAYRLVQFCERHDVSLVVIGPEDPLAEGMADKLRAPDRAVFGPGREGARLEADKAWAKQFLRAAAIPTAESRTFQHAEPAHEYIETRREPPVIKAAGLAKGKGVVVAETMEQAHETVERMLVQHAFGDAGTTVLIEERLAGPEISVLAITDGRSLFTLPPCQDHKRLLDGGKGPNTGGMGAFCPSALIDDALLRRIECEIFIPTLDALRREEIEFRGVLYAGLMLTPAGPKVLEFNVRFGDPECQPLLARFQGDLVALLHAAAIGKLEEADLGSEPWAPGAACSVVLASEGYPAKPRIGVEIRGIDEASAMQGVTVHLAAVKRQGDKLVTAGGRVLAVTATGASLAEARARAYEAADHIRFDGRQLRNDIAINA